MSRTSKIGKLLLRTAITIGVFFIIVFSFLAILDIKYNDATDEYWDWKRENTSILKLLQDKYPDPSHNLFPTVIMKNQDIPEKQKDEKRILVLGDSFVWGYGGTNVNYTWWKQLNLRIKQAGYSNVNVYATGRYDINTKDELERTLKNEELMKKIDPDLIIIGYVYNDPEERDEYGNNIIRGDWQPKFPGSIIRKYFPNLYKELKIYLENSALSYEELKKLGDILGFYRFDVRTLALIEGENLNRYKEILKELDSYANDLGIPYFYYFTDCDGNKLIHQAQLKVYKVLQELNIKAYYTPYTWDDINPDKKNNQYNQYINPVDYHPGIIWTYNWAKDIFDILKKDYNFIFENPIMEDLDKLELNINDTTPFMEFKKIHKNTFEFKYPENDLYKQEWLTNFLYYPIEKDYVKLNLEYPKKISKVKITGENIKNVEVYVNTINQEYGYDIDEARQVVIPCKKIDENIYEVGYEITSLNISIDFFDESNRNVKVEFIEG